jgi:hypothetical protein
VLLAAPATGEKTAWVRLVVGNDLARIAEISERSWLRSLAKNARWGGGALGCSGSGGRGLSPATAMRARLQQACSAGSSGCDVHSALGVASRSAAVSVEQSMLFASTVSVFNAKPTT